MLTAIRNKTQSFVVKVLAGLLVVSFAVWGIEDMFSIATSDESAIFEVGDLAGDADEIRSEVRSEVNRLRPLFGDQFTVEQAKALGIVQSVVQRQINDTALRLAAQGMGVEISDDLVSKTIRETPGFQGLGGFDRLRFQQTLSQNYMSEARYIASVRRQMANGQLLESFASKTAPKVLTDSVYRHRQEKRIADTLLISDSAQKDIPEPDETTLTKFHKDNASRFTAPEARSLSVIRLEAADLASEISVTDSEVKEAYEAREDEFTTPETRDVKQMVIPEEADAKLAEQALSQGRDFAEVAKEIAKMDASTLDLGTVSRADLPFPELADAVFSLNAGETSAPQKSPLGWHLFRIGGINLGGTRTLDEVKDELKKTIANEKAIDSLFELANKLEDAFGGGATLEDAAGQLNLKLVKIAAVDKFGNDRDGKPVNNLPSGDFLGTAFATEEGSDSQLTETGKDGYFVLRVDGVAEPILKPLDTVKEEVAKAWKAEKRAEKSKKAADTVVARVKSGSSFNGIAFELGQTLKTSPALTRQPEKRVDDFPQPLIDGIFSVSKGEAVSIRTGSGYTVAYLKSVTAAVPSADKDGLEKVSDQLGQSLRGDVLAQLAGALRGQYGVTINQRAVDELFAGGSSRRRPSPGR